MKLKELISKYISAFNNQNLNNLRVLFDKNIRLQDWEIDEKGINNVIKANQRIFNSAPKLKVRINRQFFFGKIAICILKIKVNDKTSIDVVDIIKVNNINKIISIKAYKG